VLIACERAKERNPSDEWVRPTLLGNAFDEGDINTARKLLKEVEMEGVATWKLDTTIKDLERTVKQTMDEAKRNALRQLLEELRNLLQ
jgi:hypothetical protein